MYFVFQKLYICTTITLTKKNSMKNFIEQFIPRNKEQWEDLGGIIAGCMVIGVVIYFWSI